MIRLISLVLLSIFLISCGVDTSSSDSVNTSSSVIDDPINPINPNPVGSGDPVDSVDSGDSGDPGDPVDSGDSGDQSNSIFDVIGAIEDKYACMIGDPNNGYTNNSIADTSFDYQYEEDVEDGIGINSRFPYNDDILQTEVRVYYYDLKSARTLSMVSTYEDDYRVDVDTGWANNDETVLYVKTPKDKNNLYGCYRYELSSIDTDSTSLVATKVYRNEI